MTFIQPLDPPTDGGVVKAPGTLGHGAARVSVAQRDGQSYLDDRYFTDPYRLFTPRTAVGEPVSVVLSTLSGLGGRRSLVIFRARKGGCGGAVCRASGGEGLRLCGANDERGL